MATTPLHDQSRAPLNESDARLARESSLRLAKLFADNRAGAIRVHIEPEGRPEEAIPIPLAAFGLLSEILAGMAEGNEITLVPVQAELTTSQAAEALNVSRPFLVEQLEKGAIPHRKVGTHRRVVLKDLMEFKKTMDRNRRASLEELSAIDQDLGLGYGE